jgi:ADP-heptose:LPS heptosyltransferase
LWFPEERKYDNYPPESRKQVLENIKSVAVAPGAFHFSKRWPAEKFSELIKSILRDYGAEVNLLGGPRDKELCERIISDVADPGVADRSGSVSIIKTARIIDKSDLLITNDTGVMHIAAARRVPLIALFGSTVKEFGFAPYRTPNKIVEVKLNCRPCTHIGRKNCPKSHFNCMDNITVEEILKTINLFSPNK